MTEYIKYILLLQLWCFIPLAAFSQFQEKGLPLIQNYTPDEYDGHVQNWGFTEDTLGVLYVLNLQGIIRYDGVNWFNISINENLYSIHRAQNGKIFVGGIDEFGYLDEPEDSNNAIIQYYSLRQLLPDTLQIERIFEITSNGDEIYFQANNSLIRYDGERAKVFTPKVRFSTVYNINDEIIVRDALEGLKRVEGDSLVLINGGEFFANSHLSAYLKHPEKEIYCRFNECAIYNNGSFQIMNMEADEYLSTYYMDEAIVLTDGTIAVATRAGGILHIDTEGNILNTYTKEKGLISNTVYGIYEDRYGSIWAATIAGLSQIDISLPLREFDSRTGIEESVLDISKFNDEFIFSSSRAMYHMNENNGLRKYDVNLSCYQAIEIGQNLYTTCGEKLHVYHSESFKQIFDSPVYKVTVYEDPDILILGSESGYYITKIENENVSILYEIDDINVTPVSIYVDDHKNIWVGTYQTGLIKVNLHFEDGIITGHSREEYFSQQLNPSYDVRVGLAQLNNQISFLTWGKGIQEYNHETNKMELVTRYGPFFSDTTRQYFLAEEDLEGNVWFRSGSEYQAALRQEDGSYRAYEGPLKLIDYNQNNDIFTGDTSFVWFATERGAVRYSKNHSFDFKKPFHTQINEVLVRNDSLINGGKIENSPELEYKDNELRFTYAGVGYFKPEETEYRVKLEGFDKDWTVWSNEAQKDYTNIPEGEYSFKVQSRNIFGVLSESSSFEFSVLPPWYRTGWAYILYILTIGGIFYTIYKIRINQILKVQRIRNNIASDLHDEVSATLSSISYFAQAIESDKVKGNKSRFLKLISSSAGDAKEKITDIVWAINPEHDDWQNFLSKCRRYASDLLESKDINYSLKIDEYIPGKLDMQLRQHLWLIYKEMITNAVRHSGASQLDVILKYKEGALVLVVQDDGNGMDVDNVRKGNGLVNINKRADLIEGDITLKTSEGFGTRWMLRVPV